MLVTAVWWYPNGDPNVTTWLGRLSVCTILIIFYYYYYSLLNSTYVILFFNSVQFLSRVGLSFYLNFHHPMNFMFLCVKSKMFNFFFVQLFVSASIKFQNFSFFQSCSFPSHIGILKGQLISKYPFGVIVWTKIPKNFLRGFLL